MTSTAQHEVAIDPRSAPSAAFRSLLAPVDLTPNSDRVLGRLARLPLAAGARLTLLHVVPSSLSAAQQRKAERDAVTALGDEALHLRQHVDETIRVTPLVRCGSAATEVAACAAEVNAELIVMGRGGGRVLRDAFLGSTAERVIRQCQRPVLVVRLAARNPYRRPALALDLDATAHETVRVMLRVIPPPRPPVEVIHAFDVPYHGMVYPSLFERETAMKAELRSNASQALVTLLEEALATAELSVEDAPSWKIHVRHGSPRLVVEKVVEKADSDLLVLGTHAYSAAAAVFLGTVAGDLLRAAKCDVLIVPPPAPPRR